jgi:ferredoxin
VTDESAERWRVSVDEDMCQGYGNCVLVASDLFDLDVNGKAVARSDSLDAGKAEIARMAVYDCPTQAISLLRSSDASG